MNNFNYDERISTLEKPVDEIIEVLNELKKKTHERFLELEGK